MIETMGQVQEIDLRDHRATIRLGPSPTDTRRLTLRIDGTPSQQAFRSGMVDALVRAMMAGQAVTARHDDDDDIISTIEVTVA